MPVSGQGMVPQERMKERARAQLVQSGAEEAPAGEATYCADDKDPHRVEHEGIFVRHEYPQARTASKKRRG